MDGHADRPRLVGERARDRLADPPGRVGRELVAAAPVELLDGADQAERPFLDQVEERQALVAVVLGDRDDEAQVRLDHPLLGLHVAALDLLGELDLLRGGQQRVPAGLAEEELERVGGRLERRRRRRRGRGRGLALLLVHLEQLDRRAPRTSGTRTRARAGRARTARRPRGSPARERCPRPRRTRAAGSAPRTGRRCRSRLSVLPTCVGYTRTRPRRRFKHVRSGKSSISLHRVTPVAARCSGLRAHDNRCSVKLAHVRTGGPQIARLFVPPPSCTGRADLLGCCLRRARSASRSKPSRAAQPARGRSVDSVDESATGSANSWSSIE